VELQDADVIRVKRFHLPSLVSATVLIMAIAFSLVPTLADSRPAGSSLRLLEEFKKTTVFWQQREIADQLVAVHDPAILPELLPWLTNEDRHLRANAAYVFARYGDKRGFEVICAILKDRSDRPEGQGSVGPLSVLTSGNDPNEARNWRKAHHLQWQIPADRYYAVGVLASLKDPRAVPILIPLLNDKEVAIGVPWALAQIGDKRAIGPLINSLSDDDPSFRVAVIRALQELRARDAIPALTLLLNDHDHSHVDDLIPVAEAARRAIARIESGAP
jgi:HEAT repeat protein